MTPMRVESTSGPGQRLPGIRSGVCQRRQGLQRRAIDRGIVKRIGLRTGGLRRPERKDDKAPFGKAERKIPIRFVAQADGCLRFVEKGDDGGFATFAVRDEQVSFGRFRRQPAEPDAITVEILTRKRIGIFEALSRNHRRPGAQKRIPAGADLRTAANPIGSRPYAVAVVEKQRRTIGSILLPIDFGRFGKGPQFPPELRCSVPGIPTARQQSPQQQDTR